MSGTTIMTLSELLPEDAIEKIIDLVNDGHYRKRELMPILELHRAELLKKGVDADYLGYVLEHQLGRLVADERICESCLAQLTESENGPCDACVEADKRDAEAWKGRS